jgi:hypothetical protein
MFTQPHGNPIDPRRDQYQWKALLKEAGAREARLHDAAYSRDHPLAPRRSRASRDGCHWLVEQRDGEALLARHRSAPPGHREIELLTFRFSGGLAGPGQSTTVQLTGPYDVSVLVGVQDRPHVSGAVVSKALARSAMR